MLVSVRFGTSQLPMCTDEHLSPLCCFFHTSSDFICNEMEVRCCKCLVIRNSVINEHLWSQKNKPSIKKQISVLYLSILIRTAQERRGQNNLNLKNDSLWRSLFKSEVTYHMSLFPQINYSSYSLL